MKGFQDVELAGTVKGLQAHGFKYELCGKEKHEAEGKFGGKKMIDVTFRDVNVDNYDRVAFIGGPGARALADDSEATGLAKSFHDAGKVIGAICIAPTILASAGLLKGKNATVFDSKGGSGPESKYLSDHGAHFKSGPVVIDGKFVTANGPDAAEEFGEKLATM